MEIETLTTVNPSQSKTSFANFFKRVQDAPWYQLFLIPAIDELQTLPAGAIRVLQPDGKIVILTPTGRGSFKNALAMLPKVNFDIRNWTFFLWRNMTRFNAQRWSQKNILAEIAEKTHLDYSKHFGFGDFAVVEVMQKPAL